ncbi:MAG: hypothetical protein LWY06_13980 [Firmicutes bacterium]|nr:hypothetical protein [Bacillota bacterium]
MRFKVNLQNNGKGLKSSKFTDNLGFLRSLKLKFDVFYLGLSPALENESLARISLSGKSRTEALNLKNYELDIFSNGIWDSLHLMRSKFAKAGLGLTALAAVIGAGSAEAATISNMGQDINQASGDSVKAANTVISSSSSYAALESTLPGAYERASIKLAYWHNNTGTHTNNAHSNSNTHTNTAWENRSSSHSNHWGNTAHSNIAPISHTNVSSGSVPTDYLY